MEIGGSGWKYASTPFFLPPYFHTTKQWKLKFHSSSLFFLILFPTKEPLSQVATIKMSKKMGQV
jgi:hypothetical protein